MALENSPPSPPMLLPGERLDEVNDRLSLIQKTDGLTFGTDALLLAGFVRGAKDARLLELGGGSGIISMLLCARNKCQTAICAEIQKEYADLIRRNAAMNGLDSRLTALHADVRTPEALGPCESYDVVCSNPPYMPAGSGPENAYLPKNIARREIMGGIEDFCRAAGYALRYGGNFYCVYRAERLADLFSALKEYGMEPKRLTPIMADVQTPPVLILVEAKRGGKPGLRFTSPFYIYREGTREYSPAMEQLLRSGNMETK